MILHPRYQVSLLWLRDFTVYIPVGEKEVYTINDTGDYGMQETKFADERSTVCL